MIAVPDLDHKERAMLLKICVRGPLDLSLPDTMIDYFARHGLVTLGSLARLNASGCGTCLVSITDAGRATLTAPVRP